MTLSTKRARGRNSTVNDDDDDDNDDDDDDDDDDVNDEDDNDYDDEWNSYCKSIKQIPNSCYPTDLRIVQILSSHH